MLRDKMRVTVLNLFLLLTINLYGQVDNELILTQEHNDKWFEKIEKLNLKDQLEVINRRLLADTNIFVPNNLDRVEIDKLDGRQVGFCKPLMLFGGVIFSIENRTKTGDIRYLTTLLTTKTVEKVEIVKADQATALFGSRGICKGLIITTNSKKTRRKLKKLDDKMYPPIVVKEIRWRH
jgi:hypothetical protein